jgi:ribonuclease P protein component
MLPAANRMRTAADFAHTTRRGTKVTRGSVVVYVAAGVDATPARAGLVVSKSVGNSVVRHRASRRIRAALLALLPTLTAGTRVVVRALPGAATDPQLARHVADGVSAAAGHGEGGSR